MIVRKALLLLALTATTALSAQETPSWIRRNAISPDGKTLAFSYKGDIWTVPVDGGEARQLTSNKAYESDPMWSPDGQTLVFTSWREDSKDIYCMPAAGGALKRLTDLPGTEVPLAVAPDGTVYFGWSNYSFVSGTFADFPEGQQVWTTNLQGAAPKLFSQITMSAISVGPGGKLLYEDYKGYEDPLRKHHTSSVTRDVWLLDGGKYTKLSTYEGEDRNPVFAADGDTFYFLSEQDGKTSNVYRSSLSNPAAQIQLTFYEKNPVRYLSVSAGGTIAYSYNGDLYTLRIGPGAGAEPRKIDITLHRDEDQKDINRLSLKSASAIAVSPGGKEVAVVIRGDVFVTSVDYATTRRITNTPEQERGVCFGKDGRELYYASERNGCWSIYCMKLTDKDESLFTYAVKLEEERISPEGETCFQMEVSPDGKSIAYLRDRTELVVQKIGSSKVKSLHKGVNYSYSDGDQHFAWSPDSRYILCNWQANGGWNNEDIAMIDVEDGTITNLTQSGYSDDSFRWALGGKAMTFESDKNGYRSHGSWGAETDVYVMFFEGKAYTEFGRSKEQKDIDKMLLGEKKAAKEEKKAEKDSLNKDKKPEKLHPELEAREDRIVRLTRSSNAIGDHYLTEDGTKFYFTQRLEKGFDLCCRDMEKGDVTVVKKNVMGRFYPTADGKYIFVYSGGSITRITLAGNKSDNVAFTGEYEFKPQEERTYMFEHCWKQVKEKFYDPDIHGIDWQYYHDNYVQFLPYINNYFDFQDLLSEMLGELNGSHTGGRYRAPSGRNLGWLGAVYDADYTGDGLRIKEILPGGVLSNTDAEIKAGDTIVAIEGHDLKAGENPMKYLYETAGKKIVLHIKVGGKTKEYIVTPAQSDATALYRRWVRQREEMVEKLSGGRIGYVHVEGMNSPSFREMYSKALGKYRGCEALIVDVRHNGGGWLHDDLVTFLGGKEYCLFTPRGQYIGHEPFNKWTKPSCVLVNEDCYSDASGFPYAYRSLGLGKLIGAPIPGTMTAVWWENQINSFIIFGIPQVGNWGVADQCYIENHQIEPDILVYNDPASVLAGKDLQLEAAVAEMLKEIDSTKK